MGIYISFFFVQNISIFLKWCLRVCPSYINFPKLFLFQRSMFKASSASKSQHLDPNNKTRKSTTEIY